MTADKRDPIETALAAYWRADPTRNGHKRMRDAIRAYLDAIADEWRLVRVEPQLEARAWPATPAEPPPGLEPSTEGESNG